MGIRKDVIGLMDVALKVIGKSDYHGVSICELGNQRMRKGITKCKTAKQYFSQRGAFHTSYDLNGKDGAVKVDLSRPIDLLSTFDIVTNFGTSEHVSNQRQCFENIHNLCRPGGAMVHVVPMLGTYPGHSPYHYPLDYFEKLSEQYGYEVIESSTRDREEGTLVCAVLRKGEDG